MDSKTSKGYFALGKNDSKEFEITHSEPLSIQAFKSLYEGGEAEYREYVRGWESARAKPVVCVGDYFWSNMVAAHIEVIEIISENGVPCFGVVKNRSTGDKFRQHMTFLQRMKDDGLMVSAECA